MSLRWWTRVLACVALIGCGGASDDAGGLGDEACTDDAAATSGGETSAESEPAEPSGLPPIVRRLEHAARRTSPNGAATIAILAQGDNAFLGQLRTDAGAAVPEHQDPDEEYIIVLEGTGTITIDGESQEIGPGTAVFMPANATVSFQNGDTEMVAIQVFAGPGSAAKYDRWSVASE
ncbi:MAG: cupin domain-containing protein [Sandaracinaceae bacterium]